MDGVIVNAPRNVTGAPPNTVVIITTGTQLHSARIPAKVRSFLYRFIGEIVVSIKMNIRRLKTKTNKMITYGQFYSRVLNALSYN